VSLDPVQVASRLMVMELATDSFDLGIVVRDAAAMTAFYEQTLGLERRRVVPLPGGELIMLACGTASVKLMCLDPVPAESSPPGALSEATGLRYFTFTVRNLHEVVETCRRAGAEVLRGPLEFAPGITIVVIADPDGNNVELVEAAPGSGVGPEAGS
jgi:catechol 2,3-dioxygenase-like lactoylglutathione lyase family enzyme